MTEPTYAGRTLAELRALCAAATEPPWSVHPTAERKAMMSEFRIVAPGGTEDRYRPIADLYLQGPETQVNARFIAAARTALPALLDALERAEAKATKADAVIAAEQETRAYAQEAYDAAIQAWEALEHYGQMRAALAAYVKAQSRMLERWADGDENVKRDLWRDLHACEDAGRAVLEVVLDSGQEAPNAK